MSTPRKPRSGKELRKGLARRTFKIVRAASADLRLAQQAVLEIDERASCGEAALTKFLSNSGHYHLLAIEAGRVVGSLNGYVLQRPYRREPQFLLYEIGVRPDCRNRGIGSALVKRFIAEARAAGAFEVWVVAGKTNRPAMRMYSRCRLRPEHNDDVVLSLRLKI